MDIEKEIEEGSYNPLQERIVNILVDRTDNPSKEYFRVVTAFHLAEIASAMRCKVKDKIMCPDPVPVNVYGCILMPSGAGKNFSNGILEGKITKEFRESFLYSFLPTSLEANINTLANEYSLLSGLDYDTCIANLTKESLSYGELLYSFDSATSPAFKQARSKAQLCNAGALNYICDEIGTNLESCQEVVSVVLEMWDAGLCRNKLIKNSTDNKRYLDRVDSVPVNVLWFGTPVALLNGGKEEDNFYNMLETGFARRMLFATGDKFINRDETPEEYITNKQTIVDDTECKLISADLAKLATIGAHGRVLEVTNEGTEVLAYYRKYCLDKGYDLPEQATIEHAELTNRILKVLKLAGIYAFVEDKDFIGKDTIISAIKLVEDSGRTLKNLLHREEPFIKLAKFLGKYNEEFTKADLTQKLPFYKNCKTVQMQKEMIDRACEWGYKNSIIIKQYNKGAVQFIKGETLEPTDLSKLICSYSNHEAYNYQNKEIRWDKIDTFMTLDGVHWVSHHLSENPKNPELGNYRKEDSIIPGFNLLVLDIDEGATIDWAQEVFKDNTYLIYTTKRHTDASHRFRVVLPMKFKLFLSKDDYKQFMLNVYDSLPFKGIDRQTAQRSRKWLTNNGEKFLNEGELFDPRPFIPNTSQNLERIQQDKNYGNIDNIDRWFLKNTTTGNRNNMLYRYGKMLQTTMEADLVEKKVKELNKRLEAPISEAELQDTVLTSIAID